MGGHKNDKKPKIKVNNKPMTLDELDKGQ